MLQTKLLKKEADDVWNENVVESIVVKLINASLAKRLWHRPFKSGTESSNLSRRTNKSFLRLMEKLGGYEPSVRSSNLLGTAKMRC